MTVTIRPDLSRVRTIRLPTSNDPRGALTAIEGGSDIPFEIKRLFYIWGVQAPFERGKHAHRTTQQVLVCVSGHLDIDLADPTSVKTFHLEDPTEGLYVPPMLWTYLYNFTPETVCLAAASTHYDHSEVIRSWEEFCMVASGEGARLDAP
jgi:hypothetical protein